MPTLRNWLLDLYQSNRLHSLSDSFTFKLWSMRLPNWVLLRHWIIFLPHLHFFNRLQLMLFIDSLQRLYDRILSSSRWFSMPAMQCKLPQLRQFRLRHMLCWILFFHRLSSDSLNHLQGL
jgi:hypothetical protein